MNNVQMAQEILMASADFLAESETPCRCSYAIETMARNYRVNYIMAHKVNAPGAMYRIENLVFDALRFVSNGQEDFLQQNEENKEVRILTLLFAVEVLETETDAELSKP